MKKYIKPTTTCVEIICEQMIAATIQISGENAKEDAASKEHTFKHFSVWDDMEEEEEEDY